MDITRNIATNLEAMDMKYVDFPEIDTLRYHISKDLNIVMHNIMAGRRQLSPAAYFVENPENPQEIEVKIFARQSESRSRRAFDVVDLTASMTTEEIEQFTDLLKSNSFVAQRVDFYYKGEKKNLYELPRDVQDDFGKVAQQIGFMTVIDQYREDEEELLIEAIKEQARKEAYEQFMREQVGERYKKDMNYLKRKPIVISKRDSLTAIISALLTIVLELLVKYITRKYKFAAMILVPLLKIVMKVSKIISVNSSVRIATHLLGGK